jgi:hypothetical protein
MKVLKALAITALVALTPLANASLFKFDVDPVTGGALGNDKIGAISTSFDSVNQRFTWRTQLIPPTLSNRDVVDGFWLVVNNGPNPKSSNAKELAIMYGDLQNNTLSTYVYNGANNANSILDPGILLQTDSLTTSSFDFSFNISTAAINSWNSPSQDYTGISFDENIGIWFHFSSGSDFTYTNGDITGYTFEKQGWYDVANKVAVVTPPETSTVEASAPSMFALLSMGLFVLAWRRVKA